MRENEDSQRSTEGILWLGSGLAVGSGIGVALGMAFGSVLMGVAFGPLIGILFGVVMINAKRWDESGGH